MIYLLFFGLGVIAGAVVSSVFPGVQSDDIKQITTRLDKIEAAIKATSKKNKKGVK